VRLLALALSVCAGWLAASPVVCARADAAERTPVSGPRAAPARASVGAGVSPSSNHGAAGRSAASGPAGPRSPSGPPLGAGAGGASGAEGGEGPAQLEADPLVSNGLGSPLCKGVLGAGELPAAGRRHCETSGFVAAAAPTGDYGIDVHIDTGLLGLSADAAVQDLVVTPLWMAIVWAVHAVVVMLEWCFTIDVLDSVAAGGVGSGLRQAQATLTQPGLVVVLAIASVLALYNGLIRRRVAETLGQALLMGAMMVGGLWVIADPAGTVGALGGWANRASLGTLAAAARGSPAGAGGALARSMETVFAAAIEAPWCYLEFGDVGWCRSRSRLEPRLRAAGLKIAAGELALAHCTPGADPLLSCVGAGGAQAKALERSATLLREAQSNGAIFLALPANGPARNSINEQGSLLRTLCQSGEATDCRGSTAAEAEFRTGSGTWSRLGGLLLIAAGVIGMLLLLGFIALRLLAAAIFSLLYLLMAPGMVLAPALGDGGRAIFRRWIGQLLGAVVSKLLFSFVLGVVLAVLAILSRLQALGWWTQWLLMSAFWWSAYARRHQALGLAQGAFAGRGGAGDRATGRSRARGSLARRVGDALGPPRRAFGAARWTINKLGGPAPSVEQRRRREQAGRARARMGADEQVRRTLEREHEEARERMQAAPQLQQRLSERRARLQRVRREQGAAAARGDRRRAAQLGLRGRRIEAEIERGQSQLSQARQLLDGGERARRRTGSPYTREQVRERERFLDIQAGLPAAGARAGSSDARQPGRRRDYAALAALAGYGPEQYERLGPRGRRAARLEIDRELALRGELGETARSLAASEARPTLGRREQSRVNRDFDRTLQQRMRERGRGMPSSRSRVMRDAHEVAARRKRQLGEDRS